METNFSLSNGLTTIEARRRLQANGPNRLSHHRRLPPILEFLLTFNKPLTLLLIAIAIISFFLGAPLDTAIILAVVTLSASLDFANSYRSRQAAQALENQVRTMATVIRDGTSHEIPATDLVVGDLVHLMPGKIIPADVLITGANDLYVDESSLTGEAFPVDKSSNAQAFMGSSVVSGDGYAEIIATGTATQFSKLAASLEVRVETDFDRGMKRFSSLILRLVTILAAFVLVANTVLKGNLLESLLFAVALAVGLTPELLPLIVTLNLTRGALLMSRHGVIVRKLAAIQNFGSMDILCTDKTGTLTENKIALVKAVDGRGRDSADTLLYGYLHSKYESGVHNPLDEAVLHHGLVDITGYHKAGEVPFDYNRKLSSVAVTEAGHTQRTLITKGAAEELLAASTCYLTETHSLDRATRQILHATYKQLSTDGFRVLGVAKRSLRRQGSLLKEEEHDLTFMGFLAFLDPAKASVESTLRQIEAFGIEIKILTGDNELVTQKIAADINLPIRGVLTGTEIAQLNDHELRQQAENVTIFARLTPDTKLRLIKALRAAGHVVGYMGDGINDAPSLRAADVAISVNNAVDVARETADIILLRQSLHELIEGVIEGRKTFVNTMKYLIMGISSNFGNMLSMAVASVALPFLPMLPTQVLFNNLIYDTSQLALPFDNVDNSEVQQPRQWDLKFLKHCMLVLGPVSSLYDFVTFGILLLVLHLSESGFQTGWFLESITTQILVIFIIRNRAAGRHLSRPAGALIGSTLAALAVSWLVTLTAVGRIFKFQPLPLGQSLIIVTIVATYLVTVELIKRPLFRIAFALPKTT